MPPLKDRFEGQALLEILDNKPLPTSPRLPGCRTHRHGDKVSPMATIPMERHTLQHPNSLAENTAADIHDRRDFCNIRRFSRRFSKEHPWKLFVSKLCIDGVHPVHRHASIFGLFVMKARFRSKCNRHPRLRWEAVAFGQQSSKCYFVRAWMDSAGRTPAC